jgi:Lon protease-like protein
MAETIRVNFGQTIPLFPLPHTVLLPHAVLELTIFEVRYRQMVNECLDRSGQIAVGTFASGASNASGDEATPVRPAACIGYIAQHQPLPGGCYHIRLHGLCRAEIKEVIEPRGDRGYRLAKLAPLEPVDALPSPMPEVRDRLRKLLAGPSLQHLRGVEAFRDWLEREDVSTHDLLELIGFALVRDTELKYQLLAEGDPHRRASIITDELIHLDQLVHRVDGQRYRDWPTGLSWN